MALTHTKSLILLVLCTLTAYAWDSSELELFDLVEEIQQNFYEVLGLDATASAADVRRAYRRLSLQLHPDKNKEDGAEEKFRQLVAISEVLRDEEQRKRYDEILVNGLPDWRQPVFYYRRVRKMGLVELSILLAIILTVGHYIVMWSIYWERCLELESLFPKKKKEKKNKKSNKQTVDSSGLKVQEQLSTVDNQNILTKPHVSDILPCQMYRLFRSTVYNIPTVIVWIGVQIENWKDSRRKVEEEEDEEEEVENYDDTDRERTKKRQRVDPALYEYDRTSSVPVPVTSQDICQTNSAIRNGPTKRSSDEWTREDTGKLIKAMTKYPGGIVERWEKIANEIHWPVEQVTKKAKAIRSAGYATHVDVAAQGITGGVQHSVMSKSGKVLATDITRLPTDTSSSSVLSCNDTHSDFQNVRRQKTAKSPKSPERTLLMEQSQNPSGPTRTDDDTCIKNAAVLVCAGVETCAWTQRQQKVFEKALSLYPKGIGRWDKIADAVPGKTKEECMVRYKELVEVIRRKKQNAGDQQS